MEVPGIKALLSTGVAEALFVATGLAGVGARALRFLLDGDWRTVERHGCRRPSRKQTSPSSMSSMTKPDSSVCTGISQKAALLHKHGRTCSHTTAFQQSFRSQTCPRPLFFALLDTTAAKTSSVTVRLEAKQQYGSERCLWADES